MMMIGSKITQRTLRTMPPWTCRLVRRSATPLRAWHHARICRRDFARTGTEADPRVVFIAGLPKSGTTWLEQMLSAVSGHHAWLLPDVVPYEYATGGSHDFELPADFAERVGDMRVLTKMHIHGSTNNVRILSEAGIRPLVLHRDLRDVAVSYTHYVRNTPWHPQHADYRGMTVRKCLERFGWELLPAYAAWVRSWRDNALTVGALELRYEALLEAPERWLAEAAAHVGLDVSAKRIAETVAEHDFSRMSKGRSRGEGDQQAFVRKGVAGDWRNDFDRTLRRLYAAVCEDLLPA